MKYIDILKKPFKYDDTIENMNILQSLTTLGISMGIFLLTNILSLWILAGKFDNISNMGLAGSSYFGGQISTVIYLLNSFLKNAAFKIFYAGLIGFVISTAILVLIIWGIKRISNKNYTFIQATSFIATVLVLPLAIMPLMLIGVITINSIGGYIIMWVAMASLIIMIINIIESLSICNSIGKGKLVYFTSLVIGIFYASSAYITLRIFISSLMNSMKNFY